MSKCPLLDAQIAEVHAKVSQANDLRRQFVFHNRPLLAQQQAAIAEAYERAAAHLEHERAEFLKRLKEAP